MARRSDLPRPALSAGARGGGSGRRVRDPVVRLLLFCQLMGLGLVAASVYLPFSNDLRQSRGPAVTLEQFSPGMERWSIAVVHTRAVWIVLAVLSLVMAVVVHRTRRSVKRKWWVTYAPLVALAVVGIHSVAQGWLQAHGSLQIETREVAPPGIETMGDLPLTMPATGTRPVQMTMHVEAIRRMMVPEGTVQQWELLFGGDVMFSVPLLFAWVLSFAQGAGDKLATEKRG